MQFDSSDNQDKDAKKIVINPKPYYNHETFVLFLKTIFFLNEEKIIYFIQNAKANNHINIEQIIFSEEYAKNEKDLILFSDSESRINTLKTINLKIIFKLLTMLGNKNITIKKFPNFYGLFRKLCLDYVKLLGDIFTFNVDWRSNFFIERRKDDDKRKKLITYLSNILELLRLSYKYISANLNELIENRVEYFYILFIIWV